MQNLRAILRWRVLHADAGTEGGILEARRCRAAVEQFENDICVRAGRDADLNQVLGVGFTLEDDPIIIAGNVEGVLLDGAIGGDGARLIAGIIRLVGITAWKRGEGLGWRSCLRWRFCRRWCYR